MDKERIGYLNGIVDRLVNLSIEERTTALTHLYNLRTAAVEDLSDPSDNREHWNIVLSSPSEPNNVKTLVRDLTHLTDDELAMVGMRVSEKSNLAEEQFLQSADDQERAKLQAQLAAGAKQARESYMAARQGLDMKHNAELAEKMKHVRDAIEQGINTGQDVTSLEEVFDRIEQEFMEQYHRSSEEPLIKIEEHTTTQQSQDSSAATTRRRNAEPKPCNTFGPDTNDQSDDAAAASDETDESTAE